MLLSHICCCVIKLWCFILGERKLQPDEYPLEVQLNWTKDEKEGKFVLRNAAHKPINVNKVHTTYVLIFIITLIYYYFKYLESSLM